MGEMSELVLFIARLDWKEISTAVLAIIGGFAVLAKITPWDWDDKLVGKVTKLIRLFGFQKEK